MAKLSVYLKRKDLFTPDEKRDAEICIFCGRKINRGGFWHCAELLAGVCEEDAHWLIDLYIDTLSDTGIFDGMNSEQKSDFILDEVKKRISHKNKLDLRNK